MPRTGLAQLPKRTYLRGAGIAGEIGSNPTAGKLLSSGKTIGDNVIDPATQRLIPPAEQAQSRNTRGPYVDRGETYIDVFDQYLGWQKIKLSEFTVQQSQQTVTINTILDDFTVVATDTTDFVLRYIPVQNSEIVSLNGVILQYGISNDYTIIGNILRFNSEWHLQPNDYVAIRYAAKE